MPSAASLTFVVPVWNAAPRLRRLVSWLDACRADPALAGVLLVDNGSTDATAALAAELAEARPGWLRLVQARGRGLRVARDAGVEAVATEWVAFIDDDMEPCAEFASRMLAAAEAHPKTALLGPRVRLALPPAELARLAPVLTSLAHQDYGDAPLPLDGRDGRLIAGGGMVARASAWRAVVAGRLRLHGRTPDLPVAGEDQEVFHRLRAAGWEARYEPGATIAHHVDSARLTEESLCRLVVGNSIATSWLLRFRHAGWRYPLLWPWLMARDAVGLLKAEARARLDRSLGGTFAHRVLRAHRRGLLRGHFFNPPRELPPWKPS